VHAVGVPMTPPDGSSILAFNCGGPSFLFKREKLLNDLGPRLVNLARNVEAALLRG
jgi:DNA-binding IclR family transcriptional regulator